MVVGFFWFFGVGFFCVVIVVVVVFVVWVGVFCVP